MGSIFNEIKERLTVRQVAEHFGFTPNKAGFILSPFGNEKTPSCKIYPETNSFFDFSAGVGGDVIRLASAILRCSNWEAAKYLCEAFSLSTFLSGSTECGGEMSRGKQEKRRQEERKREFREALAREVERLKRWAAIYRTALGNELFEPFSEEWAFCINELQKADYKLDILCASDCGTYRRMKSSAAGLPSDRPQWLLDALAILEESGAFQATQGELSEILAQKGGVKSNGERRCLEDACMENQL